MLGVGGTLWFGVHQAKYRTLEGLARAIRQGGTRFRLVYSSKKGEGGSYTAVVGGLSFESVISLWGEALIY